MSELNTPPATKQTKPTYLGPYISLFFFFFFRRPHSHRRISSAYQTILNFYFIFILTRS
ncbi:hypothetical protein F4809DRAFT_623942, partial [Biscogniauxia mediterranea]